MGARTDRGDGGYRESNRPGKDLAGGQRARDDSPFVSHWDGIPAYGKRVRSLSDGEGSAPVEAQLSTSRQSSSLKQERGLRRLRRL